MHLPSLQITETNFGAACDILRNRYDNKRLILRVHVHANVSQKPVTNANQKALRDLMETVEERRLALSNSEQPVDNQDIFLCTLLLRKRQQKRKMLEFFINRKRPQSYLEMKNFMEERTRALEATTQQSASTVDKKPTSSPQLPKFHSNIANCSNTTRQCCGENYRIYHCQRFRELAVQYQAQLIKAKGLCFNCLRSGQCSEQ